MYINRLFIYNRFITGPPRSGFVENCRNRPTSLDKFCISFDKFSSFVSLMLFSYINHCKWLKVLVVKNNLSWHT